MKITAELADEPSPGDTVSAELETRDESSLSEDEKIIEIRGFWLKGNEPDSLCW